MLQWQALRLRPVLPLFMLVEAFTGVGTVVGVGYVLPRIDPTTAMFLSTGGPTLTLIALGLTIVPQMVADSKARGAFDYVWSLPVPRMAFLAADFTIWLLAVLPGVLMALFVGARRYDFALQISPLALPAFVLVALMSTGLGYAVAHAAPKPELVTLLTNFIIFALFLFSPINFPVERLPRWLGELHRFLPVKYAATAVRGTLVQGYSDGLGLSFAALAVWCVLGLGTTYVLVTRRN
jgi:ABC-2 type transport system permease protein